MTRKELMQKLGIRSRVTFGNWVKIGKIKRVTPVIPLYIEVED